MTTPRERARASTVADIKAEARRQLARTGAAGLSLRAVARALGMVSSGVYHYVSSRDELLTLLIVDAYDRLAVAAERRQRAAGDGPREQWRAACAGIRAWALANPHEYALLYGSPVPGYAAPEATVGPATRVYRTLVGPVRQVGGRRRGRAARGLAPGLRADAVTVAAELGLDVEPDLMVRLLGAWTQLFGMVSFEVFGHTHGVIEDHDAFFTAQVDALADLLELPSR